MIFIDYNIKSNIGNTDKSSNPKKHEKNQQDTNPFLLCQQTPLISETTFKAIFNVKIVKIQNPSVP